MSLSFCSHPLKIYIKCNRIIQIGLLSCKQHVKPLQKKSGIKIQAVTLVFYKLLTNAAFPLARDGWWFPKH